MEGSLERRTGGVIATAIGGLVIYVACFAFGLGPILSLVVAVTFLTLVGVVGHAGTFWLYGAIAVAAWVFFYLLVPETKGKSLEQIEAHWRTGKPSIAL